MNNVLRSISIWFFVIMLLSFMISCAHAKTFRGKVIDADTKEPIEGAVVVAYWYKARTTPLGEESMTLKGVKETLTDKNGQWTITGPKGRMHDLFPYFSTITGIYYTQEPSFIIFKPGYCSWPQGFYIDACRDKIKPGGNGKIIEGETIELSKLTKREDRLRALSVGPIFANTNDPGKERQFLKKQIEFLRLIDEERKTLGLSEYGYYEELKYEK